MMGNTKTIKIALYSDLHQNLPPAVDCDLAIIAGDICGGGGPLSQYVYLEEKFRPWLMQFPKAAWIAGNHDWVCQESGSLIPFYGDNHVYLRDNYWEPFKGLKVWGCPWSLPFCNWAFAADEEVLDHKLSPLKTIKPQILVSHGPPYSMGDKCPDGFRAGSCALLKAIRDYQPALVVVGHIHSGKGVYECYNSCVVNAAVVDEQQRVVKGPVMVQLSGDNWQSVEVLDYDYRD